MDCDDGDKSINPRSQLKSAAMESMKTATEAMPSVIALTRIWTLITATILFTVRGAGNDCNDSNYFINPGVAEVCGDGTDNNCNEAVDEGCGHVCGDGRCDARKEENASVCPVDCS